MRLNSLRIYIIIYMFVPVANADWVVDSALTSRAEYNDNVFLSKNNPLDASALIFKPKISLSNKDAYTNFVFGASADINTYSESGLNSVDHKLNANWNEIGERNIYAFGITSTNLSNLNPESSDFGILQSQIERRMLSFTPSYRRLLTETSQVTASVQYSAIDYDNAEGTGFQPYTNNTVSLAYNDQLSERAAMVVTLSATDYDADDGSIMYKLYNVIIGGDYRFSERVSGSASYGRSLRKVTEFDAQTSPGTILVDKSEITSAIYNAKLTTEFEKGDLSFHVKKSESPNAYGGVNDLKSASIIFEQNISPRWSYVLKANVDKSIAVAGIAAFSDRTLVKYQIISSYKMSRDSELSFSYMNVTRDFADASADNSADSNRVYLNYRVNYPEINLNN